MYKAPRALKAKLEIRVGLSYTPKTHRPIDFSCARFHFALAMPTRKLNMVDEKKLQTSSKLRNFPFQIQTKTPLYIDFSQGWHPHIIARYTTKTKTSDHNFFSPPTSFPSVARSRREDRTTTLKSHGTDLDRLAKALKERSRVQLSLHSSLPHSWRNSKKRNLSNFLSTVFGQDFNPPALCVQLSKLKSETTTSFTFQVSQPISWYQNRRIDHVARKRHLTTLSSQKVFVLIFELYLSLGGFLQRI